MGKFGCLLLLPSSEQGLPSPLQVLAIMMLLLGSQCTLESSRGDFSELLMAVGTDSPRGTSVEILKTDKARGRGVALPPIPHHSAGLHGPISVWQMSV